jgi:hypothetical protein
VTGPASTKKNSRDLCDGIFRTGVAQMFYDAEALAAVSETAQKAEYLRRSMTGKPSSSSPTIS